MASALCVEWCRRVPFAAWQSDLGMDLLGSIMGSMDKPPTASEREKKMKKSKNRGSEGEERIK